MAGATMSAALDNDNAVHAYNRQTLSGKKNTVALSRVDPLSPLGVT